MTEHKIDRTDRSVFRSVLFSTLASMRSRRSLALSIALSPVMLFAQAYFQQRVDHVISVRLDDVAHVLHGEQAFTYTNQSPQTLDTLWIHLWPNAYSQKNTALDRQLMSMGELDLHFASDTERGSIDSLQFTAEGIALTWGYHDEHPDIGWIKLPMPLAPASSITIDTPFRVKIPDGKFSRLGHTGQAYYITQWFPKPAVYDAQGWHAMPYLTAGEFYSEFGSYDVSVTLPANYIVGATGILQNEEERQLMDRMAGGEWTYPTPLKDIATGKPLLDMFPASASRMKTLRYVQDNVHDFAWFADKRFVVRKGSVTLPRSGRTVTTWALHTPKNARLWEETGITALNESVRLYSQWVGDYPYEACTAIDGTISAGGGMEYPMITIIGDMGDAQSLDNVIAHEVGHNWFYGILGSNERDHAWMDEGMNSFVELRYMRERYPDAKPEIGIPGLGKALSQVTDAHRFLGEATYRLNARRNLDQALSSTSADFTMINYGGMVYNKTAMIFDHLFAYLGDEDFDRCMHAYFEEWKFKHPQPDDVRQVFERESGKELGWMFEGLIGTTHKLEVKAVKLKDNTFTYRTNSNGHYPFPVTGWNGSEILGTTWIMGGTIIRGHSSDHSSGYARSVIDRSKQTAELPWSVADRLRVDADNRTLDIDRRNNEVRSHGLFRRAAKPELKYLLGIEKNDRRSVYWTPLAAWNGHDGFQVGMAAYNTVFPSQRTEWVFAPLYALGSERWGGAARIEHHFDRLQSRLFQNIHLGLSARSASTLHDHYENSWYTKLQPSIRFDLKREPLTRAWEHSVNLRGVYLNFGSVEQQPGAERVTASSEATYGELSYRAQNREAMFPALVAPVITIHEDFVRASLELRQGFTYNAKKDQLRLRAFAGTFLSKNAAGLSDGLQSWGLTWGAEDLLFDHAYLERGATEGFTGRQFNKQQGGFKTPFLQGGSDTWIASLNAELDLPTGLPLSLFASAGFAPLTTITQEGRSTSTASYMEAGIGLQVVKDVLEIWFPLIVSQRITDEEEFLERSIGDRIRFVIALEQMDPTKLLRKLKP